MFPELESVLSELRARRDTPAARVWAMHCRFVAVTEGEAEAAAWARMILAGAEELNRYEAELPYRVPGGRRRTEDAGFLEGV